MKTYDRKHRKELDTLVDELSQNKITRRNFIRRGTILGISAVLLSDILALHKDAYAAESPSPEVLEKIKNDWSEIIDAVKSKKIHLGSFLNEGYPTGVHDRTLEISFGKENGFHINTINQNRQLIQEIILEKTGFKLKINCKKKTLYKQGF